METRHLAVGGSEVPVRLVLIADFRHHTAEKTRELGLSGKLEWPEKALPRRHDHAAAVAAAHVR
jgi:hypothetical protein